MKLIMLRHGETEENRDCIVQGQSPGRLSELGRQQAKTAAQLLKDQPIDIIFSSDLDRAKDTLGEVLVYHPMRQVVYTAELRERAFGVFEGGPEQLYYEAEAASESPYMEFKPEGGESLQDLLGRAQAMLSLVLIDCRGRQVLFCTHGGLIRAILCIVLNMPFEEARRLEISNTSLTLIEFSESGEVSRCMINDTDVHQV